MEFVVAIIVASIAALPATIKIFVDSKNKNYTLHVTQLNTVTEDVSLIKNSLSAITKNELTKEMMHLIERGYSTPEELDSINELYKPYHDFGWNGSLDTLYKKVCRLEVHEH